MIGRTLQFFPHYKPYVLITKYTALTLLSIIFNTEVLKPTEGGFEPKTLLGR